MHQGRDVKGRHLITSVTRHSLITSCCSIRFSARIFFVGICKGDVAKVVKRWLQKHKFYSAAAASPLQLVICALLLTGEV